LAHIAEAIAATAKLVAKAEYEGIAEARAEDLARRTKDSISDQS
jgi:hypothetical protein